MAGMRDQTNPTASLFHRKVHQMPEGYYSGDRPNPNLRSFVEAHIRENPYNPETDDYDVPAFDKPIETTKATAIYNMHTYWSKKPHDAIRQYICHYTKPGDLVLDPMSGSGGTALAALMEGRKAIAIDRSPAATFITKNYCTPVDVHELQKAFEELRRKVKTEIDWLYETRCDRCGGIATTAYTVYSQVFQCPRCLEKIPLYDCVEVEGTTAKGKPQKMNACPHCYQQGIIEVIRSQSQKFGAVPVLVTYLCDKGCKPVRGQRRHNDPEQSKQKYFQDYDLKKLKDIDSKDIPYWYPKGFDMTGFSRYQRDALRLYNITEVSDLFTKRNLWALAIILNGIKFIGSKYKEILLFTFSSILLKSSRMMAHNSDGIGRIHKGTYYIPQINHDVHVWKFMQEAIGDMVSGYTAINNIETNLLVSTSDIRSLNIPDSSVDYIFTDPPYAGKVQYGELNFVWESWLDFDTNWHKDEIVINEIRGKSEIEWASAMTKGINECYRVLKPGRCISLCYHDTSEGTWALIQDIMAKNGFIVEKTESTLFIDTKTKTTNQYFADKVNKRDLIINFRKPKPGELAPKMLINGSEDEGTFNDKVRAIIREYLAAHPGSAKDRIYDEVVSRLVRAGKMEPHNFEELLRQVAEEEAEPAMQDLFTQKKPDLFGTHERRRWYLKDTEPGADEVELATEEEAAKKIAQFLARRTTELLQKSQPDLEKLHVEQAGIRKELTSLPEDDLERRRPGLRKELKEVERKLHKLQAEREEWQKQALHYGDIFEFYLLVTPKPRKTFIEMLEDFCYMTDAGNWRPPLTDKELQEKAQTRALAVRRKIQRFCRLMAAGEAIPADLRPDSITLAEWIRYCKKAGMYEQGKLLYEKGGLNLNNLPEETMVGVEEDYQVCVRLLARR